MDIRKQIGDRIRRARELRGWTQSELAHHLGKNATTVSNYENGNRAISVTEIPQLAQLLQVPIAFFFEESAEALTEQMIAALAQQRPPDDLLMQELIHLLTVYLESFAEMRTSLSTVFDELDDLKRQIALRPQDKSTTARSRLLTFTVEEASLKTLLEMLIEQQYVRVNESDEDPDTPSFEG
jgi:transcriptional regulator with XRE-family HTH domain